MDSHSTSGIKIDRAAPDYGWQDMLGAIRVHGTGGDEPVYNIYRDGIRQYEFNTIGDEVWVEFHIPHDYATGTDLYIHSHWSHHNASTITTGSLTWTFETTYAKGHNQAPFPATTNSTAIHNAATTNVPQYQHMITEVQLSASGGGVGLIDTDDIEIDGLILVRVAKTEDTMADNPFLHFADIHYQSTGITTKNKAPDFYA